MEEFEGYLDRALSQMPDIKIDDSRFNIPVPRVFYEGRTSILDNFDNIADYLNRDRDHFMKYILREIGTAGKIDGSRAIFQGRFSEEVINSIIDSYVDEFVTCTECGRPDTHLNKSDRVLMLKCDACGAHRPVKKRKIRKDS
ncbi:MAG: translation initiation factor IF-2 subunit beta [Halobacteriota archaeon]|nr:translation initiation factor IF-2 subunit beta [Halobacteriota archaeon]